VKVVLVQVNLVQIQQVEVVKVVQVVVEVLIILPSHKTLRIVMCPDFLSSILYLFNLYTIRVGQLTKTRFHRIALTFHF